MEIEIGWMNLTPCSKLEWRPFPELPVAKFGEQRLYGYVDFNADGWKAEMEESAKDCAMLAVGVAGGFTALVGNASAFAAAFVPSFLECMRAKFSEVTLDNVKLETRTVCLW